MEQHLLWVFLVGAMAGGLAGLILRGRGFGTLGNVMLGMLGALLGSYLFDWLSLSAYGLGGAILMAVVGAVALFGLVGLVKRA